MNDDFKLGDRVRLPPEYRGEMEFIIRDEHDIDAIKTGGMGEVTLVSRPVYLTPEQRTCLLGCICAAESDGYHDDQIAAAYDALDATPEER